MGTTGRAMSRRKTVGGGKGGARPRVENKKEKSTHDSKRRGSRRLGGDFQPKISREKLLGKKKRELALDRAEFQRRCRSFGRKGRTKKKRA